MAIQSINYYQLTLIPLYALYLTRDLKMMSMSAGAYMGGLKLAFHCAIHKGKIKIN